MKKIKLFLIRNYQRIIRFLISFSVIGCLLGAVLTASAAVVYSMPCSPIQYDSQSCYLEIVRNDGFHYIIYVTPRYAQATPQPSSLSYYVSYDPYGDNILKIFPTATAYAPDTDSSAVLPATIRIVGYYIDQNGATGNLQANDSNGYSYLNVGSGLYISGIHGYNCNVSGIGAGLDFVFIYGNDNTLNDKMDKIIAAIEANKSSAEKNAYSGPSSDQKQAQSDLDSAEASINSDTASARASTVDVLKNFTVPGDIMKGLLSVTNLFNSLCANIPFAPIVLNFSLAIGAAAFLLGLSAWAIGKFGGSRK